MNALIVICYGALCRWISCTPQHWMNPRGHIWPYFDIHCKPPSKTRFPWRYTWLFTPSVLTRVLHVIQRFPFPFYIFCQFFSSSHFAFSIADWLPQQQTRGESYLTAATNSIISTRGRAISQQGHQGAASEVPLFIYFSQVDGVIHKLNEWQSGQCQQLGAQWRLECICLWVQKPIHYKRVIIVPNRLIHAER